MFADNKVQEIRLPHPRRHGRCIRCVFPISLCRFRLSLDVSVCNRLLGMKWEEMRKRGYKNIHLKNFSSDAGMQASLILARLDTAHNIEPSLQIHTRAGTCGESGRWPRKLLTSSRQEENHEEKARINGRREGAVEIALPWLQRKLNVADRTSCKTQIKALIVGHASSDAYTHTHICTLQLHLTSKSRAAVYLRPAVVRL